MSLSTLALAPLIMGFSTPAPPQLACEALPQLLMTMQVAHYAAEEVAPVANRRAVRRYIESMDSTKALFLQSEVDRFTKRLGKVFEATRDGDCSLLGEVAKLSIERAEKDEATVRKLLGKGFKIDERVQIDLDIDDRKYAKTEAERTKRLVANVHFQISNQLENGSTMKKAKKRVLHRYELASRRLRERREPVDLPEIFAKAFASGLDPHSDFFSAKDLADFRISMHLSLEGIGAVLRSEDGYTRIQSIVPGGAADKEGTLQPKDKVVAVAQDGEEPVSTIDMDLRDVVQMIRGKKGTKVILTVQREKDGTPESLDIAIVRDKIDVKESAAKLTFQDRKVGKETLKIGVLELPSFYGGDGGRSAHDDVKKLLEEAMAAKVDALVLDLSRNGGGLLNYAVSISGLFMQTGAIVATRSSGGDEEVLADEDDATVYSGPLVVLTSPVSASASEILAGALKDYNRAIIAGGEHTFGKGTVQQLRPLPGGLGALKLTMGMFFRPSGNSTQQRGVRAHLKIPSVMDGYDIYEKDLDDPLPMQSMPPFLSSSANGRGKDRFAPITGALVDKLSKASAARIGKDNKLQEVVADLAERDDDKGTITLAELKKKTAERKAKAKAKAKKSGKKDGDDEDDVRKAYEAKHEAFVAEGVNIAADLARAAR